MKKIIRLFFIILLFQLLAVSVFAQEKINQFKSDISINKDGTINVKEEVDYDFGSEYRHGIYRDIPYLKTNKDGKKYIMILKIIDVKDQTGNEYKYTLSKINEKIHLKIGDPDQTITGTHIYIIDYKVSGVLTYFSDHDELYWNVSGNDWTVPINQIATTVTLPSNVVSEKVRLQCYTGASGITASDCVRSYDLGRADFNTSRAFGAGEGLTVVVSFPKGLVSVLEPQLFTPFWEAWYGRVLKTLITLVLIVVSLLWYLVYPVWIVIKWYKYGRDPKVGGPITAWFDPPKTESGRSLTPAETGTLIDERAQLKDVCAMIVDLARRGYFKIEEKKKKDFYLVRRSSGKSEGGLLPFEQTMFSGIFDTEDEVRLKDKQLFTTVEKVKSQLYNQLVKGKFFPKNPQSIRNFYTFITVMSMLTFNLPLFLISLIFGRAMPAKTTDGARAANVAKSLRNFLSSQERQLKFQAEKQLFFEKLLPFAVAFGVEKIWAERFKDIDLKQPDWYTGYQTGQFNSVIFANSLNSSFTSFASAATPVSSSTGFSSGFSGGSSGGGGGGGGGGSW